MTSIFVTLHAKLIAYFSNGNVEMAVPLIGRVKEKIATFGEIRRLNLSKILPCNVGAVHSLLQISTYEWIDKIKNERFSWMGKRR